MRPGTLEEYRAAIVDVFPGLRPSGFTLLPLGWDCEAVDVDGRLIFKFPRDEEAAQALAREAALLTVIRPAIALPVPDMTLHEGPPIFSRHRKLAGDHISSAQYEALPKEARRLLAADLALLYAALHNLDSGKMADAGAAPVEPLPPPEDILGKARPLLPTDLQAYADRAISEWAELPPDPYGTIYGYFDGHGWNMAFDHGRNRLNGVYDFADSGFGPLHQDFIYSNFISPDLTARIIDEYEALTSRKLDRRRIALLTGVHRLSELASLAGDADHAAMAAGYVAAWAAHAAAS
ncbi:phosphotransferase [Inquilinus sp. CAU 1745]|uniref:phosphotransferase n=1 Tax=Inquilinus sp. CAU 1745 TaxID=3140369 RepID=UPI00325B79C1